MLQKHYGKPTFWNAYVYIEIILQLILFLVRGNAFPSARPTISALCLSIYSFSIYLSPSSFVILQTSLSSTPLSLPIYLPPSLDFSPSRSLPESVSLSLSKRVYDLSSGYGAIL